MIWISIFLKVPVLFPYKTDQTLIAAIFGGVLMGISMGLIFRAEGTIAGSTILAKIMNRYFGVRNGSATLCFDLMVAIPSGLIIGFQNMLLTVIELYISAVVLNKYLEMLGTERAIMVISKENQRIAKSLSENIGRGVTMLKASGFYSKSDEEVLYFICTPQQWTLVIPIVQSIDPDAFVITEGVRSVRGQELSQLL